MLYLGNAEGKHCLMVLRISHQVRMCIKRLSEWASQRLVGTSASCFGLNEREAGGFNDLINIDEVIFQEIG
jgi:hypothetical protein